MEPKMKIIVCACTERELNNHEVSFSISNNFSCQCPFNYHSGYFVVPCERHALFKPIFGGGNFVFKCQCLKLGSFEVCENCINIRYVLNYVADKICMKQVPKAVEEKTI